jgi:sugar-specific transcriptional regulator TrmB
MRGKKAKALRKYALLLWEQDENRKSEETWYKAKIHGIFENAKGILKGAEKVSVTRRWEGSRRIYRDLKRAYKEFMKYGCIKTGPFRGQVLSDYRRNR